MIGQAGPVSADSFGHRRAVHCQLLIYRQLIESNLPPDISALDASPWAALIRFVGGHRFSQPDWIESGRVTLDSLIAHQQPDGQFVAANPSMNPESRWYEELITLHAITNFAMHAPSSGRWDAVRRSAQFHLLETQPDHATAEPWGLLAFIRYAPALADQMLHAMSMQYPNGLTAIPLLLLQDVRYGLQHMQDQIG